MYMAAPPYCTATYPAMVGAGSSCELPGLQTRNSPAFSADDVADQQQGMVRKAGSSGACGRGTEGRGHQHVHGLQLLTCRLPAILPRSLNLYRCPPLADS